MKKMRIDSVECMYFAYFTYMFASQLQTMLAHLRMAHGYSLKSTFVFLFPTSHQLFWHFQSKIHSRFRFLSLSSFSFILESLFLSQHKRNITKWKQSHETIFIY